MHRVFFSEVFRNTFGNISLHHLCVRRIIYRLREWCLNVFIRDLLPRRSAGIIKQIGLQLIISVDSKSLFI